MMYTSFISATFILVVFSLVYGESDGFRPIRYRNCKSNFELLSVEAAGCPGKTNYCPFKRGTEPRIRIGFKPTRDVRELETSVRAKLGAVFVPFNLEEKNACIGGNLTCPLKAGQSYYYSQSVKILHQYPKVDVQVNWLLNDKSNDASENDMNKREVCIIFLAKVID